MNPSLTLLGIIAIFGIPASIPTAAIAQDQVPPPSIQTQSFTLAYTLRNCDLNAERFVHSVKALKDVEDDKTAGVEVARLSHQAADLRHRQATAYAQVAQLLKQMAAPAPLSQWASKTAESLESPLAYSSDAAALKKTEPDTATVLAEIDEIRALKTVADGQQPSLDAWLKLTGGSLALWTSQVGSYTADLHAATQTAAYLSPPYGLARLLLQSAPAEAPSEVRGDISELVPRGGGNLQDLITVAPTAFSTEKMTRISDKLLEYYRARKLSEILDKPE